MDAEETMRFLLGSWHVKRTISDYLGAEVGAFEGIAEFSPSPGPASQTLRYEESGEVRFGSYRGHATRRLDYVRASETAIALNFLDGHHFVDLVLASGSSFDVHCCGEDTYEITMIARSPDVFEERWRVRGPQKDYLAVTTLQRRAAEGQPNGESVAIDSPGEPT